MTENSARVSVGTFKFVWPFFDHPCDRDIGVNFIRHSQASGFNDNHFHDKRWVHHCSKFERHQLEGTASHDLLNGHVLNGNVSFSANSTQAHGAGWCSGGAPGLVFRWFSFRISAGTAAILRFFMTLMFLIPLCTRQINQYTVRQHSCGYLVLYCRWSATGYMFRPFMRFKITAWTVETPSRLPTNCNKEINMQSYVRWTIYWSNILHGFHKCHQTTTGIITSLTFNCI